MDPAEVENLKDVFKCFICMEKLRDARLCPHCSKFCCFLCIRRWLTEQRPQCPHCRCSLQVNHLVKCRWAEEAGASVGRSVLEADRCREHCEKLSVFCITCEACICHHCALWGGFHAGHTLKPLQDEYRERAKQITEEVKKLRHRLCHLLSSIQKLEANIEEVREAKEERVEETRMAMELMVARLDSAMKSRLVSLTGQKRTIGMEVEMVEGVLAEVETQLASAPHSHLIAASPELFRMLTQIQRSPPTQSHHISPVFPSEVVPEYEGQSLVLANFTALRTAGEAVYSQPLILNGLKWRLKVYPDGNGVVKGNYLSVFLELSKGPPNGAARYEYRVEMLHQVSEGDPERSVIREFGSEFEVGECWGYNRFFKLDCLLTEGFLDSDTLRLHFKVRPPTYYQKAKDLEWYLSERDREASAVSSPAKSTRKSASLDEPVSSSVLLSPALPSTPSEKDIEEEGARGPQPQDVDDARRVEEGHQVTVSAAAMHEALRATFAGIGLDQEESETESESYRPPQQPHFIPPPHHVRSSQPPTTDVPTTAFMGESFRLSRLEDIPPWFNALVNPTAAAEPEGATARPSRQQLPLAPTAPTLSPRRRVRQGLSRSSSLDVLCGEPEER